MKNARKDWFPNTRPNQMTMFTNVRAKIGGYAAILPLNAAKISRIEAICDTFIAVFNFTEQARATGSSITEWQDNVFNGSPSGTTAPEPPPFPVFTKTAEFTIGIFDEFRELRDDIVGADGYTDAIDEDLMIVAPKSDDVVESDLIPEIGVQTAFGYKVKITGSLQRMDAMRFYYKRKGGSPVSVAYLTKLPGEFKIDPQTAGEPESGELYAFSSKTTKKSINRR